MSLSRIYSLSEVSTGSFSSLTSARKSSLKQIVRQFRKQVDKKPNIKPVEPSSTVKTVATFSKDRGWWSQKLFKSVVFSVSVCGGCYVTASIWHHENHKRKIGQKFYFPWEIEQNEKWVRRQKKFLDSREKLSQYWNSLSNGVKTFSAILAVNVCVFLAWRLFPNSSILMQNFLNGFHTKKQLGGILSAFSHFSVWHIGLNMYCLSTFAPVVIDHMMGMEQFVAFYLSAATLSNLGSLTSKYLIRSSVVSLGASGAIMATLAYFAMKQPNERLQIVFLPFFNFSCSDMLNVLVAFETCALLIPRFRIFDHAAHLSGLLFGIWYAKYGEHQLWRNFRIEVVQLWRRLTRN